MFATLNLQKLELQNNKIHNLKKRPTIVDILKLMKNGQYLSTKILSPLFAIANMSWAWNRVL